MTAHPEGQDARPQAPPPRRPADTFSNRLLLTRALAGHLSIREAADQTGLNREAWRDWERGRRPRDILDVCRRIADTLDVDHEWLLFGGPLASPKGVPTKRTSQPTREYLTGAIRPRDSRPAGRALIGSGAGHATGARPDSPARPVPARPRRLR